MTNRFIFDPVAFNAALAEYPINSVAADDCRGAPALGRGVSTAAPGTAVSHSAGAAAFLGITTGSAELPPGQTDREPGQKPQPGRPRSPFQALHALLISARQPAALGHKP